MLKESFIVPYGALWLFISIAFLVWLTITVRRILNVFVWYSLVQLRIADIRFTVQHQDFTRLLLIARRFGTPEIREYINDLIRRDEAADNQEGRPP
ncbi:MAG: hypothetical protein HY435_02820 [Candidatus Liptonbacteria bacterium]|nr:hypothetical protein [Candidatus Liptonbacteria bacterium]